MNPSDGAIDPGRTEGFPPADPDQGESAGGAAVSRPDQVELTSRALVRVPAAVRVAVRTPLAGVRQAAASTRAVIGRTGRRCVAYLAAGVRWPARSWSARRARARHRTAARATARQEAAARVLLARQTAMRNAAARGAALQRAAVQAYVQRLIARDRARGRRRRRLLLASMFAPVFVLVGLGVGAYYVDSIPMPAELQLPESTTVYFSDGTTPMARLGTESRTILAFDEMNDAVKEAIVAAEDRRFWRHPGIDAAGVLRAARNNIAGGQTQGASTITQQYARIVAGLTGVSYARKTREAVVAWKIEKRYTKDQILEFYLNTVPFGRGAYGIEAVAQAFFGKTARRTAPAAQQVTVAEAMVLACLVKQPEPDPDDPAEHPGYDPARSGRAAVNAMSRWLYVREGMVELGYLTRAQADGLAYPQTVRAIDASASQDGLERPTGLIVAHVLSELRHSESFKGKASDYIQNGGFRIVTTVDKRAQGAAEAAADIHRASAPAVTHGQPANWQAALVAVEPGTGRILAYYGGNKATDADRAGWFYDADGDARGYGQHPPGSSFKVYVLAEALRQGISVRSLNVPFFDLTERLGPANVVNMARLAGIDSMWTSRSDQGQPVRVDLQDEARKDDVAPARPTTRPEAFGTEVGIGQYGVTVLDQANGMATFAADGQRSRAHFVREATRRGERVYAEQLIQSDIGLSEAQVDQLTWVLSRVPSAKLGNGWDAAGMTGTWQAENSRKSAHTWMIGYTRALAAAVWVGTTDGAALTTRGGGQEVLGSTYAVPIWQQFMTDASGVLGLDANDRQFRPPPSPAAPGKVAGASPR
ncbi:transglycosylase domain-containing protein [Micromonospora sp. SL1-18]|uniref:transglycosylase domain-containing protein n=1 Tax=Micromonospora sp. SL1-18 TaxID=3399128 RepID=UPI003A4D8786